MLQVPYALAQLTSYMKGTHVTHVVNCTNNVFMTEEGREDDVRSEGEEI